MDGDVSGEWVVQAEKVTFYKAWRWDISELRCEGGKDLSWVDRRMKTGCYGRRGEENHCGWGWEQRQQREPCRGQEEDAKC